MKRLMPKEKAMPTNGAIPKERALVLGVHPKSASRKFQLLLHDVRVMPFDHDRDFAKALVLNKDAITKSDLVHAIKGSDGSGKYDEGWDWALIRLLEETKENKMHFFVMYLGSRLVAMGGLSKDEHDGSTAYFSSLRVDPKNGRQGIGETMMLELERRARELGYSVAKAETQTVNDSMLEMLPKLGYGKIGEKQDDYFDYVIFRKKLLPSKEEISRIN